MRNGAPSTGRVPNYPVLHATSHLQAPTTVCAADVGRAIPIGVTYFFSEHIAARRFRISSGVTSSLCVATHQRCPKGSWSWPERSP